MDMQMEKRAMKKRVVVDWGALKKIVRI